MQTGGRHILTGGASYQQVETKGSKVRIIFVGMILTQRKKQPPRVAQLNDVANNNKDDDNRWQTTNRQSGTKETARTDSQERVPATLSRQQELVMC